MDRGIQYDGEIINASDICNANLFSMIGLGKIAKAVLGSGPQLNDLTCVPTSPATLNVLLNPGEIYSLEDIDATDYGPFPANSNQIVKCGQLLTQATIPLTAPVTPGNSINYLIQVIYEDSDASPENRAFFEAAPAVVDTTRLGLLTHNVKAGTPAATGTQVTPTPDAGYTGAWVVTVANGQTQITAPNINAYPGAPFILEKLQDKISQASGDIRYAQKSAIEYGSLVYAIDTGAANAYVISLNPAITSYVDGMEVNVHIANTNSAASTININGLGTKSILNLDGSALLVGQIVAGHKYKLIYNSGTNAFLINLTPDSFIRNIASDGYIKILGLIIQWFTIEIPVVASSTISTVSPTFPLAFPTGCFQVHGTNNNPTGVTRGINVSTYNYSTTGFTVDFSATAAEPFGGTEDIPVIFYAIGH